MPEPSAPRHPNFTMFRSAEEETSDAAAKARWANEGGHMHAKSGRIVQVDHDIFKVVFTHEDGTETEQACETMREGEAIIRRNTPTPPERDTSRDDAETLSNALPHAP